MRKIATTTLAAACALVLTAAAASSAVLLTESFPYADGGLVAVSGGNWLNHSGAGTDIGVVSGHAFGNMANAPDDNRSFAAQTATAKTYACFLANIPTPAAAIATSNYFIHLKDTGTSNFAARVAVMPSGSTFTFGIGATSSTFTAWPSALLFDTWYVVAISYDAASGMVELWVNPANELSPKVTAGPGTTGFLISSIAMRQSATASLYTYLVDDIGVGTTFSDACGQATPTSGTTWGRIKTIYR